MIFFLMFLLFKFILSSNNQEEYQQESTCSVLKINGINTLVYINESKFDATEQYFEPIELEENSASGKFSQIDEQPFPNIYSKSYDCMYLNQKKITFPNTFNLEEMNPKNIANVLKPKDNVEIAELFDKQIPFKKKFKEIKSYAESSMIEYLDQGYSNVRSLDLPTKKMRNEIDNDNLIGFSNPNFVSSSNTKTEKTNQKTKNEEKITDSTTYNILNHESLEEYQNKFNLRSELNYEKIDGSTSYNILNHESLKEYQYNSLSPYYYTLNVAKNISKSVQESQQIENIKFPNNTIHENPKDDYDCHSIVDKQISTPSNIDSVMNPNELDVYYQIWNYIFKIQQLTADFLCRQKNENLNSIEENSKSESNSTMIEVSSGDCKTYKKIQSLNCENLKLENPNTQPQTIPKFSNSTTFSHENNESSVKKMLHEIISGNMFSSYNPNNLEEYLCLYKSRSYEDFLSCYGIADSDFKYVISCFQKILEKRIEKIKEFSKKEPKTININNNKNTTRFLIHGHTEISTVICGLFSCNAFRKFIESKSALIHSCPIYKILNKILDNIKMEKNNSNSYVLSLMQELESFNTFYDRNKVFDAKKILEFILDEIIKSSDFTSDKSPFPFLITQVRATSCRKCNEYHESEDKIYLPFIPIAHKKYSNAIHQQFIEKIFNIKTKDGKNHVSCTSPELYGKEKIFFKNIPDVLILSLPRINYNENKKNSKKFFIPDKIQLNEGTWILKVISRLNFLTFFPSYNTEIFESENLFTDNDHLDINEISEDKKKFNSQAYDNDAHIIFYERKY